MKLNPIVYSVEGTPFTIAWRDSNKWAVLDGAYCLSKSGFFDYEPLPSGRTKEFLEEHRFDSIEEAQKALDKIFLID